ncbi:LEAF RUST 10 DISEASE-RESISTANCE LOCUS RECEPTOR-LIKE PROTEIN KINASE-like 1.4 isoform X2 [Primulina tabacum]|uniref:LEAF RUST 10 DISEASE-RESISTANCE LOCUS RECEPTOR-LIKE PROTEIN KINASE-like 1.4 isoform X2 n=1 Tax=Primulina tabacum TaxID=48773 RepID=UPI003F592B55
MSNSRHDPFPSTRKPTKVMSPKLDRESFFMILVILLLSQIQGGICEADASYQTCSQPFRCANQQDMKYPFYGNDRPAYCGYPGFELDCQTDVPRITIMPLSYRVLSVDNNTYSLEVAREDLWNNICPYPLYNTTLNSDLFSFSSNSNDQNISLNYGCSGISSQTQPQPSEIPAFFIFTCGQYGFSMVSTPEAAVDLRSSLNCSSNIFVPVNQTAASVLARLLTGNTLESGFSIQWSANNSNCQDCKESGGVCGFNQNSESFACYCSNGTYPFTCNNTGNGKGNSSNNTGKIIGPALGGAALAGIIVGWLIFHYRAKRKKRIAGKPAQNTSKETSTHPSSKGVSTPYSTSFTRSIPSYPTSKSELGGGSTYFGAYLFSYAELEAATDNFDSSRELGDGGFGTVYYGNLPDGRAVAVKRLYENNVKRVDQFMNEVEILTKLRHPNLVMLYGCTSKRSRDLLLVYEYIPNGTVADHLHGNRSKSGSLSWQIRLKIAIETADALAYLHRSDIIHRDVKTNNVLLDNDFNVKVADFGLSRLFPADVTHVSTAPQGTPGYVDPEYYQCFQLTEKSDVYSFGVMLIELISSLQAVDTNRHRQDINLANMAINKIQNRNLSELVDASLGFETNSIVRRLVTLVAELAFQCLQQERDMRPSMGDVLEALRRIQNEDLNVDRVEIVDVLVDDDTVLLKGAVNHPVSPDSVFKWNSSSTPDSSV